MPLRRVGAMKVAVAIAASLWVSSPSAAADPSASYPPAADGTTDVTEEAATKFRSDHGLRSDTTYVRASLKNQPFSNGEFGVPLTADEALAVHAEIAAQEAVLPTLDAAQSARGFVSAYFTRDQLTITVSDDGAAVRAVISARAPVGATVTVERRPFTLAVLEQTQKAVAGDWASLARDKIILSQVGIDSTTGLVHVVVSKDPTGRARETLLSRYGPSVDVEITPVVGSLLACNSIKDCGTKGGLAAKSGAHLCSTGFLAQQQGNVFSPVRMVTAGHCIKDAGGVNGGLPWQSEAGTVTWGKGTHQLFGAANDVGAFSLGTAALPVRNEYFASGTVDIRRVRGVRTEAAQTVGLNLCRSGRTSGFDCGILRARSTSVDLGAGFVFCCLWKVEMASALGDSGAGVIDLAPNMNAVGTLVGGTREGFIPFHDYTWYNSMADMETFMGLRTCGAGTGAPSC